VKVRVERGGTKSSETLKDERKERRQQGQDLERESHTKGSGTQCITAENTSSSKTGGPLKRKEKKITEELLKIRESPKKKNEGEINRTGRQYQACNRGNPERKK